MKTIRCFLLLFVLPLTGCDHCLPTDQKNYDIPASFNTYFGMFKPGNWWVYQNSDSSIVDSLFVSNYNFITLKQEKTYCGYVQSKSFDLNAGLLTEGGRYNVNIDVRLVNFSDSLVLFNGYYAGDIEFNNPSIFGAYPGPPTIDTIGNPYQYSLINQISIKNKAYNNVLLYNSHNNYRTIYFAPNVGIVRYTVNDTIMDLATYVVN